MVFFMSMRRTSAEMARGCIALAYPLGRKAVIILCCWLSACMQEERVKTEVLRGEIFGSYYAIKYVVYAETPALDEVERLVLQRLEDIDQTMSTWEQTSELSQLNRDAQNTTIKLSQEMMEILQLSARLNQDTLGAFDITVGPLVNLWGFGSQEEPSRIPDEAEIQAALERVGLDKLQMDLTTNQVIKRADLYLDLSAIAKGYAVDEVGEVLNKMGIENYLVEIGGELRAQGHKPAARGDINPWQIAIETPSAKERGIQRIITLRNMGMATSGDYRNYYEKEGVRYSHIIDPNIGMPIRHKLASVSVAHPETAIADAWATALLVLGEERGRALATQNGLAAYFIKRAGTNFVESWTPAFDALLYRQEGY